MSRSDSKETCKFDSHVCHYADAQERRLTTMTGSYGQVLKTFVESPEIHAKILARFEGDPAGHKQGDAHIDHGICLACHKVAGSPVGVRHMISDEQIG